MRRAGLVAVLVVIFVGLGGLAWLLAQKDSPLFKPIQQYNIVTQLNYIKPKEVEAIMSRYLGLSFWEVELDIIQAELTRLDWASKAKVKRNWPDQLYVSIEEQKPVARWGDSGLVNQEGEVFYPKERYGFHNLVVLDGELSDSADILVALSVFQEELSHIDFTVSALKRQLDGVWIIKMLDGSEIVLDSKDSDYKLSKFVAAYSKLSKGLRKSPQVYDLRYSNGFIVGKSESLISQ